MNGVGWVCDECGKTEVMEGLPSLYASSHYEPPKDWYLLFKALSVVEKGRTANAGSYSYDYADIADVVKATRPKLAEHGIVALTPVHDHGNGLGCTVTFLHSSGDRLDFGPFPFPHGRDAQATGSMVTYHRRYALVAALGMAAGDDDDGAAAQPRQQEPAWTVADAKKRLVTAVGQDLAPQAWAALGGDAHWQGWEHAFPTAEVEAWLNQPAEPIEEAS